MKIHVTLENIENRCVMIVSEMPASPRPRKIYGVPRGGLAPAFYIAAKINGTVVSEPKDADIIIDDLIDSGATRDRYKKLYPNTPFIALYEKKNHNNWLVFPWEVSDTGVDTSSDDIFVRFLEYIGEDPTREGLRETPKRMMKAWDFWTSGYNQKPEDVFKEFSDGGEGYDQMILVSPIPFYSHCEHHMAAIFGDIHIGYIPNGKIAGLSKFARLVDIFARRLQVQERLTVQIADAIEKHLNPQGVAVMVDGRHFCMESRGIQKASIKTKTSAMRGVFLKKLAARNEFFNLLKS